MQRSSEENVLSLYMVGKEFDDLQGNGLESESDYEYLWTQMQVLSEQLEMLLLVQLRELLSVQLQVLHSWMLQIWIDEKMQSAEKRGIHSHQVHMLMGKSLWSLRLLIDHCNTSLKVDL